MIRKIRRLRVIVIILLIVLAAVATAAIYKDTKTLELSYYDINSAKLSKDFDGYKIVQISDLHNDEFGDNNDELVSLISHQNPDMIAITGDILDSYRPDIEVCKHFIYEIVKIAPVYFVNGNHESRFDDEEKYSEDYYKELCEYMENNGVKIINNESVDLKVGDSKIVISAIDDPEFYVMDKDEYKSSEYAKEGYKYSDYVKKFNELYTKKAIDNLDLDRQSFNLLLYHRPTFFDIYHDENIDLVLSGHYHGGIVRLPKFGAVFVPDQGFFPDYAEGLITKDNTNLVVSRGLGTSSFPFRVNNRPEVVVISLHS